MSQEDEQIIAKGISYFANQFTPLTRQGITNLIEDYVDHLPKYKQETIGFFNNRPSLKFVDNLLKRQDLCSSSVRMVEDKRVEAMTMATVAEHIARVQSAMNRYNIHDPERMFNMDQTGCELWKILGRSLRKGVGEKGRRLIQKCIGFRFIPNKRRPRPSHFHACCFGSRKTVYTLCDFSW